jgi:hypothetical protein
MLLSYGRSSVVRESSVPFDVSMKYHAVKQYTKPSSECKDGRGEGCFGGTKLRVDERDFLQERVKIGILIGKDQARLQKRKTKCNAKISTQT